MDNGFPVVLRRLSLEAKIPTKISSKSKAEFLGNPVKLSLCELDIPVAFYNNQVEIPVKIDV